MKKITLFLGLIFLVAIVSAAVYMEPWSQNQDADQHNLTNLDYLQADTINGTSFIGTLTGNASAMNWTGLYGYPTACPDGYYLTTLGDSVTCTAVHGDINVNSINSSSLYDVSDESLVLALNFNSENNVGNYIQDSSSYLRLVENNNATHTATGGFNGGGAFIFNGNNSYIDTNIGDNYLNLTVCTWVKLDSSSITKLVQRGTGSRPSLAYDSTGSRFLIEMYNGSSYYRAYAPGSYLNKWSYVCGRIQDQTNVSIFVNGVHMNSSIPVGSISSTSGDWTIGASATPSSFFNGTMDELVIYNRVLSDQEINTLYLSRKEIPTNLRRSLGLIVKAGNATDFENKVETECPSTGCIVQLPCGNYSLNSNIVSKGSTQIIGSGECTVLNVTGTSFSLRNNDGGDNILIKDLVIDVNNFSLSVNAIYMLRDSGGNDNVKVENVHFKNSPNRVASFNGTNIKFLNNYLDNVGSGVSFADSNLPIVIWVEGNTIINREYNSSNPTEYGEGIEINFHYGESKAHVNNNHVEGFREDGIDFNAWEGELIGNTVIMVTGETRTSTGITASSSYSNGSVYITGNHIYNISKNGRGIQASLNDGTTIFGNTLRGSTTDVSWGIVLHSSSRGVNILANSFFNLATGIRDQTTGGRNISLSFNNFFNVTTPISAENTDYYLTDIDNVVETLNDIPKSIIDFSVSFDTKDVINNLTILDSSGNNFHGLNNVSSKALFNFTGGFNGGGAAVFNKSNYQNIVFGDVMGYNKTLSFWFKSPANPSAEERLFVLGNDSNLYPLITLRTDGRLLVRPASELFVYSTTGVSFADGNWHYVNIYMSESISNTKIYIDGQDESGSKTDNGTATEILFLKVGGSSTGATTFNGSIDNIIIYNRALTEAEMMKTYYYNIEYQNSYVSQKNILIDSSGNALPSTTSLYSLGSSLLRWLKGWFVDLDVSGTATISKLNATGNFTMPLNNFPTCTSGLAGNVRYNTTSNHPMYCNTTAWVQI
jgi:hypothetical protein